MPDLATFAPRWRERLSQLVEESELPGTAVGVSYKRERIVLTAGIENLRSGHPVLPQTAFQLGSISKVYCATLLAAVTELDAELLARPVAGLIPEAGWMSTEINVGHLLTHSSGLGGDWYGDTGRGDDCIARYVTAMEQHPRDFPGPPGERYSYCNSGFAVLGRLIEVLTGTTYAAALKHRLLDPLGVESTSVLPEDTLLRPNAMGHNRRGNEPMRADDQWRFPRARDPIGGVTATAGDVLTFAELHIADGVTKDGTRVIPAATAALMRTHRLEAPRFARPSARGLGWEIFDTPGGTVIGHDGATIGQLALLRLVPEQQLALTVLTNGIPDGRELIRAFEAEVLGAFGYARPAIAIGNRAASDTGNHSDPALGTGGHFDPAPYLGLYRNLEGRVEVSAVKGGLRIVNVQETEGLFGDREAAEFIPIGDGAFVDASDPAPLSAIGFADPDPADGGRCQSYFNGRVSWRVRD